VWLICFRYVHVGELLQNSTRFDGFPKPLAVFVCFLGRKPPDLMFDYNSSSILCPVKLTFSLMNDNTSIFQTISCDVPAFNNQSYDVCDDVAALSFQSYSQIGW